MTVVAANMKTVRFCSGSPTTTTTSFWRRYSCAVSDCSTRERRASRNQNRKPSSSTQPIHHSTLNRAPSLSRGRSSVRGGGGSGSGSSPLAEFEGGQYDAAEGFDEKEIEMEADLDIDADSDLDLGLDSELESDLDSDSSDWKEAYDRPELYDSAFSFRDFSEEVDFLLDIFRSFNTMGVDSPSAVVELGCGPAKHSIEFSKRGIKATGVDRNEKMIEYAKENMRSSDVLFDLVHSDMRSVQLTPPVDLAFCLIGTIQHLKTTDDFMKFLDGVADSLHPGGLLVTEHTHPFEAFNVGSTQSEVWTVDLPDGKTMSIEYGSEQSEFDPVTQVWSLEVKYVISDFTDDKSPAPKTETHIERTEQRMFTLNEIDLMVRLHSRFEVVKILGALSTDIQIDDADEAYRMVHVLRKK